MKRWLTVHRRGFVFRWRCTGVGLRLIIGEHKALHAERRGTLVHAWHRKRFCLAALPSLQGRMSERERERRSAYLDAKFREDMAVQGFSAEAIEELLALARSEGERIRNWPLQDGVA